jgi:hypothetical protein
MFILLRYVLKTMRKENVLAARTRTRNSILTEITSEKNVLKFQLFPNSQLSQKNQVLKDRKDVM